MLGNNSRPYAWGRMGHAPAPGSTFVWDRALNKSVQCTPANCPFATPIDGVNGTQYVNRAPVLSGNGNSAQDVRTNKLTTVALQVSMDFGRPPSCCAYICLGCSKRCTPMLSIKVSLSSTGLPCGWHP